MQRGLKILFAVWFASIVFAVRADICAICGQPINGEIYLMTDKVTGQQVEVCSNCVQLPRCFICGLPVKDGVQLPDGRWLCARDAKTAVLDMDDVRSIFTDVHDDLDRIYARFTTFPTNIDVSVIDRVDVDSMFRLTGNSFESPDVLGVTEPFTANGVKRYKISLLTGQPTAQLREVCAHELSHAWVGENVPAERHARLDRDAEEGFCEMMGYLLMDAEGEEGEKKRVMENAYTRGQVQLFVAAEQEYGFDEVLDWMQYGVEGRLEEGHLDEIRDVKMPASNFAAAYTARPIRAAQADSAPATIRLQGILWGSEPSAIINGKSFFAGDEFKVPVGGKEVTIRCLNIGQNSVRIWDADAGGQQELELPTK
jgi:Protein DA1